MLISEESLDALYELFKTREVTTRVLKSARADMKRADDEREIASLGLDKAKARLDDVNARLARALDRDA